MELYNIYIEKSGRHPSRCFIFWVEELYKTINTFKMIGRKDAIHRHSTKLHMVNVCNILLSMIRNIDTTVIPYAYGYYSFQSNDLSL